MIVKEVLNEELLTLAEEKAKYYRVSKVKQGNLKSRYWYDKEGSLFFFDRFHAETYF